MYTVFCGECSNSSASESDSESEKSRVFRVTIRLTQKQLELLEDTMYDNLIDTFNSALPEGWFLDDYLEIGEFTTKERGDYLTYSSSDK